MLRSKTEEVGKIALKVKEVSQLAGISVRALHHYDEIGLLRPERTAEAGYRLYAEQDLERLQQILFFRELGFTLQEIRGILDDPAFDRLEALELQRRLLERKLEQTRRMIDNIDRTIRHAKGEIGMTDEQRFEGIEFTNDPYEREARERWGDARIDESKKKLAEAARTPGLSAELQREWEERVQSLAGIRHEHPASLIAQQEIGRWCDFLHHFGTYSPEALAGLGRLYTEDERFTAHLDRYGAGLAAFMGAAMEEYARRHGSED
nr:MerR family transcriptional regulator [Saccharibacillus sp. WB 17]